jgi:hypothetical protein
MRAILISNIIRVNNNNCNSVVIKYRDQKNSFGFIYDADTTFFQQVRIGAYLRTPSYPTKEKTYRDQSGNFRSTSVIIDKQLEFHTDQFDDYTRDAIMVASKHSEFYIDGIKYYAQGAFDWEDNEFNDLANGKINVLEQGFNQNNIEC